MSEKPFTETVLAHSRVRVPAHVVFRAFPSETVLLNLDTGNYHGLNATAARMLELLQETGSTCTTAEMVAREYDRPAGPVMDDLVELCSDLLDRGLLELAPEESG